MREEQEVEARSKELIANAAEVNPKEQTEQQANIFTKLANDFFESGQYETALRCFKNALIQDNKSKILWTAVGRTLNHLERFTVAVDHFNKALAEDKYYEDALLSRSFALTRLGKYKEALEDLRIILESNVLDKIIRQKALHFQGNAYLFSGQTASAIDSYLQYLSHDLTNTEVWYNLGCAVQQLAMHKNAIFCYAQTLSNNIEHVDALTNTAHAFFSLGEYKKAITFFRKAIAFSQKDVENWTNLGVTYEKLEQNDAASFCFHRALTINPNYAPAKTCQDRLPLTPKSALSIDSQKEHSEHGKITLLYIQADVLLSDLQSILAKSKKEQLDGPAKQQSDVPHKGANGTNPLILLAPKPVFYKSVVYYCPPNGGSSLKPLNGDSPPKPLIHFHGANGATGFRGSIMHDGKTFRLDRTLKQKCTAQSVATAAAPKTHS